MAADFSGRIWKLPNGSLPVTTPFGTGNVKIKGGSWTGETVAGKTFIITDVAGRIYTSTWGANSQQITFGELGWLSGPITFSGTTTGEIDLYLGTR
jgi:hypothetical protein